MLCDYRTLLQADPFLEKYKGPLSRRAKTLLEALDMLPEGESLANVANAHQYYGFHQAAGGWVFRTCAPAARSVCLVGDFNGWDETRCPLKRVPGGDWEALLPPGALRHGQRAALKVHTKGETLWRVPATSRRVWRNPKNGQAYGRVWCPSHPFIWKDTGFSPVRRERFIYECHPGACGGKAGFARVRDRVLPHMKNMGYNTLLLMAAVEHADPATWGECPGHFFAPSAWLGTPQELKSLVDTAHALGIAVLADMPHQGVDPNDSGLCHFDGTPLYTREDSATGPVARFAYDSPHTVELLLSCLRYWLEEFHLDGFRFCDVTSMLYKNGGTGQAFLSYREFFSGNVDESAVLYLQLASILCRQVRPGCLLIAREESAMPGLCAPVEEGGLGFDLRHGPMPAAYWEETVSRFKEKQWRMGHLWQSLSDHLPTDSPLACCECSRQSRPGNSTLAERLQEGEPTPLEKPTQPLECLRMVELHKMIRLATCFGGGAAYLTFMGNEFARPGSLDPKPRPGKGGTAGWPWSLAGSPFFYHRDLMLFEREMLVLASFCQGEEPRLYLVEEDAKAMAFWRGRCLVLFNFHPARDYVFPLPKVAGNAWRARLNTGWQRFGGTLDDRLTPDWLEEGVVKVRLAPRSAAVYSRPMGKSDIRAAMPGEITRQETILSEITAIRG